MTGAECNCFGGIPLDCSSRGAFQVVNKTGLYKLFQGELGSC